ncbi:MAG: hypothetical protein ACHQ1G_10405 [Planctomycetota bacterium]
MFSRLMKALPALSVIAVLAAPTNAGCCCGRSAACQERLTIQWHEMEVVAPEAADTGTDPAAASRAMRARRPMLVLVTDGSAGDKAMAKLEEVVFKSEQVAIGAKFFDTLKVSTETAAADRVLAKAGAGTPRLILLTRDYKVHEVLDGNGASASKLVKGMASLARAEYQTDFDTVLKDYVKLLNERDRLDDKKATLEGQKTRAGDNGAKAEKVAREMDEVDSAIADWTKREEALLAFKLKEAEKATA